ncbi:MAG TPA: four helix bundle suffix domain-containing protein [Verrucomicrobiae bacterium]|nr:four helix bundle suffix domain-containing protein [Verrucomicrobiae bacterium]
MMAKDIQPGDRTDPSNRTDPSDRTDPLPRSKLLRPSGGYRQLRSFQTATVIYDATVSFCEKFLDRRSRTVDQMVQAARSGRQNIAEGSRASATSSQTELRLVNVARASLDELLLDYEDFLRQRHLQQWRKDAPEARRVRLAYRTGQSDPTDPSAAYRPWLTHANPEVIANTLICLIHQTNYLLDQQIAGLEREFITKGGYTEQLASARVKHRRNEPARADAPACPLCSQPMIQRTAKQGRHVGQDFWGCSTYPECKGTRPLS